MCERMCAKQIDTLVYSIGDSVIQACGFCNPRRGQRKRSSSTTGSVGEEGGAETLFSVLFTPPPPPSIALGETQQLQQAERRPLMEAQWLLFVVPCRDLPVVRCC